MEEKAKTNVYKTPSVSNNDDAEINIAELLFALKEKLLYIIAAMVICGGIFGAYSKFVITPVYNSTAMVYVLSKETTLSTLANLQIGTQLTLDYMIVVTSRPVLEDVIEELGLDMTHKELAQMITINNPTDTRILSITVTDVNPERAKAIADCVASTSSEYIGEIMEMVPPKMIEDGEVPLLPAGPNTKKNALIGALLGAFVVCGIVIVKTLLDDTIKSEDDVARYLELPVLASVPLRTNDDEADKQEMVRKSVKAEQKYRFAAKSANKAKGEKKQ